MLLKIKYLSKLLLLYFITAVFIKANGARDTTFFGPNPGHAAVHMIGTPEIETFEINIIDNLLKYLNGTVKIPIFFSQFFGIIFN